MSYLLTILLLVIVTSCNSGGSGNFNKLEDGKDNQPVSLPVPVEIGSFSPEQDPFIMIQNTSMNFGVSLKKGVSEVKYDFSLDNGPIIQSSGKSFYTLESNSISPGDHVLKVIAYDNTSSDEKEFRIRKNSPAQIVTSSPALTGVSINCGSGSLVFSGVVTDLNNDTMTASWELDSNIVTPSTPFTSLTTVMPFTQLTFTPDCTQTGTHSLTLKVYDGFETTARTWSFSVNSPPATPGVVAIQSFTPTTDPVILTSTSTETFAVTTNTDAGIVNYEFVRDNSTTLQTGAANFIVINGSTLTPGYHSIRVRASNGTSFADKTFNLRKNSAPQILTTSPALSGTGVDCSSGSIQFEGVHTDVDGDNLSRRWVIDGLTVNASTPFISTINNPNSSLLNYTPDCTAAGSHSLTLELNDGHEITTKSWVFSVNNPPPPPGNVQFLTFTPTIDPVVLTNSSSVTFAVSIDDGAGEVTYTFSKDGISTLQTGASPFLVLNGATLSPGTHTLKVRGTNSVSADEKIFNLRKNTPPAILSHSPALAGVSLNCGQDTLTFNAIMSDADSDLMVKTWEIDSVPVTASTPFTTLTSGATSAQLTYTPDCSFTGAKTVTLKVTDSYEVTTTTWSINVINPAVESISSYFPLSNNITYLSTDTSKPFTATGTGIGALTFTWKLDGATIQTDSGVSNTSLNLLASSMSYGAHTLEVILTDSSSSNNPALPAKSSWNIYRNMRPAISGASPSTVKNINQVNTVPLSAIITDQSDTFTVTVSKGALLCTPSSGVSAACSLSAMTLPTSTGSFSAIFSPGSTFLGENTFQLTVTDSYGESASQNYAINANYFSDYCNNLAPGQICTLVGPTGLGSGLSLSTDSNKVRVTPAWITQDDVGNWFFSDYNTNVVYYYNTKGYSVSRLGQTIAPNSLSVVAGVGFTGTGGNGSLAKNFALSMGPNGGSLAWDPRDAALYIADHNNHRVVRINSTGRANIICGAGTSTIQGALATTHDCNYPGDLEIDTVNRRLYLSMSNRHVIRYIDISNTDFNLWTAYIVAGSNTLSATINGSSNLVDFSGNTTSGTARLSSPWALYLDVTDQILYFSEFNTCKIRAVGLPGATTQVVAGQSITANSVVTITNGTSCASEGVNTNTAFSGVRLYRPFDLIVEKSGGSVSGMYIVERDGHRVTYCNNTGIGVTIGNQPITANNCSNVLGTGTANPGFPISGKNTPVSYPHSIYKANNGIYVGDRGFDQIKFFQTNVSNGSVSTFLGGTPRAGYSGNIPMDSNLVTLNYPYSLMYRESKNSLYISDASNGLIRSISLSNGKVEEFIGGSIGGETRLSVSPTSVSLGGTRGMAMFGDNFLYADTGSNCYVRAYNPGAVAENIFGTIVNSNRTTPVAGNYNNCGHFTGTSPLPVTDPNAKFQNLYGIAVDEVASVMYVSSRDSHCILRVNSKGTMEPFIGSCGTMASGPVYGETYNSSSLKLRYPAEIFMDPEYPGNFFFADFTDTNQAHIKYVNLTRPSVTINGTTILLNNVETVYGQSSTPGYIRSVTAFENWVCFTSSSTSAGANNVTCYDRTHANTTTPFVFGGSTTGAIQWGTEQEGAAATTATFAAPMGLAFDANGNLYVSEWGANTVRMIKRWW